MKNGSRLVLLLVGLSAGIPALGLALGKMGWEPLPAMALILAFGVVGLLSIYRVSARLTEENGSFTPAMRRYSQRTLIAVLGFVLSLMIAILVAEEWQPRSPAASLVAILPAFCTLAMIWLHSAFLREEQDEYVRSVTVAETLFGNRLLLIVATLWGFGEQFGPLPHVPAWWAVFIFAAGRAIFPLFKARHA